MVIGDLVLTVIDLLDPCLHPPDTGGDIVKRCQSYISLDLNPGWDLVDGALTATDLCRLHGRGTDKLVPLLIRVLEVKVQRLI